MSIRSSTPIDAPHDALAPPASDQEAQQRAAAEFARRIGARRADSGAPIRTILAADASVERTPLSRLLSGSNGPGGGRGGHVRLKLLLSLYWVCVAAPYDVIAPARAWAALIGLDDHANKGVRRIHQAVADLEERQFITVEDRGGRPPRITLLSEEGDGTPYEPPTAAYNQAKAGRASNAVLARHQYFKVPSVVWTDGHIARLTGPALAVMLVLLAEQRGGGEVWFSPARADERFGLAPTTITKGLRTLRELGLLQSRRKAVSEQGTYIGFTRYRNVYTLSLTGEHKPPTMKSLFESLGPLSERSFEQIAAESDVVNIRTLLNKNPSSE